MWTNFFKRPTGEKKPNTKIQNTCLALTLPDWELLTSMPICCHDSTEARHFCPSTHQMCIISNASVRDADIFRRCADVSLNTSAWHSNVLYFFGLSTQEGSNKWTAENRILPHQQRFLPDCKFPQATWTLPCAWVSLPLIFFLSLQKRHIQPSRKREHCGFSPEYKYHTIHNRQRIKGRAGEKPIRAGF